LNVWEKETLGSLYGSPISNGNGNGKKSWEREVKRIKRRRLRLTGRLKKCPGNQKKTAGVGGEDRTVAWGAGANIRDKGLGGGRNRIRKDQGTPEKSQGGVPQEDVANEARAPWKTVMGHARERAEKLSKKEKYFTIVRGGNAAAAGNCSGTRDVRSKMEEGKERKPTLFHRHCRPRRASGQREKEPAAKKVPHIGMERKKRTLYRPSRFADTNGSQVSS